MRVTKKPTILYDDLLKPAADKDLSDESQYVIFPRNKLEPREKYFKFSAHYKNYFTSAISQLSIQRLMKAVGSVVLEKKVSLSTKMIDYSTFWHC